MQQCHRYILCCTSCITLLPRALHHVAASSCKVECFVVLADLNALGISRDSLNVPRSCTVKSLELLGMHREIRICLNVLSMHVQKQSVRWYQLNASFQLELIPSTVIGKAKSGERKFLELHKTHWLIIKFCTFFQKYFLFFRMFSICVLHTSCTKIYVSLFMSFPYTMYHYFLHASNLVLLSLQMHHFFCLLLCSLTALSMFLEMDTWFQTKQTEYSLAEMLAASCGCQRNSKSID